jgi:hypothetical protein
VNLLKAHKRKVRTCPNPNSLQAFDDEMHGLPMARTLVTLDHIDGITIDPADAPFGNYQAVRSSYEGLKTLALTVRELERQYIASDPHAEQVAFHTFMPVPDIVPCAFNWFAVTLVSYMRLVALVQLMQTKGWKSEDLAVAAHRAEIKDHCSAYAEKHACEVYKWRNKVAAHFAATDPRWDDNLSTLEQSVMSRVEFQYPYYWVGLCKWSASGGESSSLHGWALTKVYEDLGPRFWRDARTSK